jgi:single-stranded DNA-binding protein
LAYSTIAVALGSAPGPSIANGKEVLECYANTTGTEPVNLLLRVRNGSAAAAAFATKASGSQLIVSGDLILNDTSGSSVLYVSMFCDAFEKQFINETVVVGRLSSEAKPSPTQKSVSRSLAVNRYQNNEEITDWFRLRGFGFVMEKLTKAPKGALVSVHGCLEQRKNKDGNPYLELKCRSLRVHSKPKSQGDPAAGTSASGYDAESFNGSSDMSTDWSN